MGSHGAKVPLFSALSGGPGLFLIAGPCVIESRTKTVALARRLADVTERLGIPFIFKASYDKANRTSVRSFRGPGLKAGLDILAAVRETVGVPVLSDVHEASQVEPAARVLDVLQIPAFLCRQTDLVLAAARTGKPVNIKKGQFLAPDDMMHVVEKVLSAGNARILVTERGASFGYHDLVVDMRSIAEMKTLGFPVVIDASHGVQKPGGAGGASGGERRFIPVLARAAVAAGADGLFLEVHDDPARARSDKDNAWPVDEVEPLLAVLLRISEALGERR
ncbi:MAG: 3-deoxy-8-phosphooctulonate synthase [Candidatus Aminicenantes bacterium]|nr:3-deoxy-8-phosphooctulonate synthase [Candidatus Aminicenantes bacterium]